MYKYAVRTMIRRSIGSLNQGRVEPTLKVFAEGATLTFPGDNTWSRMFHTPGRERHAVVTHEGRDEIEAFLRRYVEHGIQMEVEDILVNGPPWRTRVAVRCHVWIPESAPPGTTDRYSNRAVLMATVVWGKIVAQEDYEDPMRVDAYEHAFPELVAR